jgi:hypothetical protein
MAKTDRHKEVLAIFFANSLIEMALRDGAVGNSLNIHL